jgi:hypothetical protein
MQLTGCMSDYMQPCGCMSIVSGRSVEFVEPGERLIALVGVEGLHARDAVSVEEKENDGRKLNRGALGRRPLLRQCWSQRPSPSG